MKTLNYIIALLLTTTIFAQEHQPKKVSFTVEQKAEIFVKRLDLVLELNNDQIDKIIPIFIAKIKKTSSKVAALKKDKTRLSNDDQFNIAMVRLKDEATLQNYLKKILTRDQLRIWKQLKIEQFKGTI